MKYESEALKVIHQDAKEMYKINYPPASVRAAS